MTSPIGGDLSLSRFSPSALGEEAWEELGDSPEDVHGTMAKRGLALN